MKLGPTPGPTTQRHELCSYNFKKFVTVCRKQFYIRNLKRSLIVHCEEIASYKIKVISICLAIYLGLGGETGGKETTGET